MIVKRNNSKFTNILLIFLLSIFLFFYFHVNFKSDFKQFILILTKEPFLEEKNTFEEIKTIPYLILNNLSEKKKFNKISINIKFKNQKKILDNRKIALKKGILENNRTEVPAEIFFDKKNYKALVQLKGNLPGHWESSKQWSLKIKLIDGYSILGMREFSLTKHKERSFPSNQIISDFLKKLDILTPDFYTLLVDFNGDDWGIMLAEEQITSTYFEKRKKKDSIVLKPQTQDRTISMHLNLKNKLINVETYNKVNFFFDKRVGIYNKNKYLLKSENINFSHNKNIKRIIDLVGADLNIDKYIDIEKVIDVFATSLVWNEYHSMHSHNQRYFLNSFTGKLEIIPTDFGHGTKKNSLNYFENYEIFLSHIIDNEILKKTILHDNFNTGFKKSLIKIKNNFNEFDNILKKRCKNFAKNCKEKVNLLSYRKNLDYSIINADDIVFHLRKKLINEKKNEYEIENEIKNLSTLQKNYFISLNNNYLNIENHDFKYLNIKNLSPFNININSIILKNKNKKFNLRKNFLIKKSTRKNISSIKLDLSDFLDIDSIYLNQEIKKINVKVFYTIEGIEKIHDQKIYPYISLNNEQGLKKENFIKYNNNNTIIKTGNWIIEKPIIIKNDTNLVIEKNTNLKFKDNSYIYIENGSLFINGEKNSEVTISSFNKKWKGIYINNYKDKNKISKIKYTTIKNTTYFENEFTSLTGGINFFKGHVIIEDSKFDNNYAEDFLNVTNAKLLLKNTFFSNSDSDALDSDFSDVEIRDSKFSTIKGDAIDTSGSKVKLENLIIENINDKAISAGENSAIQGKNIIINNAKIAVASKDSSDVQLDLIQINEESKFNILSYRKKYIYDVGKIYITNSIFDPNKIFSEEKNSIFINNLPFNKNTASYNVLKKYPFFFDEYIKY